MAIDLDSGDGLFDLLGRQISVLESVQTYVGTTLVSDIEDLMDKYQAADFDILIEGVHYLVDEMEVTSISISSSLRDICVETLLKFVNDDTNLGCTEPPCGLEELISQMITGGDTVEESVVGSAVTLATSNKGNGTANDSIKWFDGLTKENAFAEDIVCRVTDASGVQKVFEARGQAFVGPLSPSYPTGSGSITPVSSIVTGDNANGNVLVNSDFERFTLVAGVPDKWDLEVGIATADIDEESASFTGASALRFIGDGATLTQIAQDFNSSGGTTEILAPSTAYSVCLWLRHGGIAPVAGVLTVDLYSNTDIAVIADESGTDNTFDIDLTSLSDTYTAYTGDFITPRGLPISYAIRLRLKTALTSGREAFVDTLSVGAMTETYAGGPYIAIHEGSAAFAENDRVTISITNDRAGKFQDWFDRLYDMNGAGVLLPSATSGGETIPDSLIT